jgi:cytochrome P450
MNEQATAAPLDIDFLDPRYCADPYPALARLRSQAPVHLTRNGLWVVTGYREVKQALMDARLSRDLRHWAGYGAVRPFIAGSALERLVERWMLATDPPIHDRLRHLATRAWAGTSLAQIRSASEAIADELLSAVPTGHPFDFIAAVARPFPLRIVAELLGVTPAELARLGEWADALDPVIEPRFTPTEKRRADAAVVALSAHVRQLIVARRSAPSSDLFDRLMAAGDGQAPLDDDELVAMFATFLVAGHSTTMHLLGNALHTLSRRPEAFAALKQDPSLIPRAVEELLRFDPPLHLVGMVTREPMELGGRQLEPHQLLFCMIAAANRDPSVFEEPDALKLARHPNPHLSFGSGAHFCLGAALARVEAQVLLAGVTRRWSRLESDLAGARWHERIGLHGLARLPLTLSAA